MISRSTAWTPSTNHHPRPISSIPAVTPKANRIGVLHFSVASSLFKAFGYLVLAPIIDTTSSQTLISGQNLTISEVTIVCDFRPKRLSPARQRFLVFRRAVCWGSLLYVILNSVTLTSQNAEEIMSVFCDGSFALPEIRVTDQISSTLNFKNGGPRLQRIVWDKPQNFKYLVCQEKQPTSPDLNRTITVSVLMIRIFRWFTEDNLDKSRFLKHSQILRSQILVNITHRKLHFRRQILRQDIFPWSP